MPDVINDEMLLINLGAWMLETYELGFTFDEIVDSCVNHSPIIEYASVDAIIEVREGVESCVLADEQEQHEINRFKLENTENGKDDN